MEGGRLCTKREYRHSALTGRVIGVRDAWMHSALSELLFQEVIYQRALQIEID